MSSKDRKSDNSKRESQSESKDDGMKWEVVQTEEDGEFLVVTDLETGARNHVMIVPESAFD